MTDPLPTPPLLGDFIRAHRERISPESVGLPRGPRRRTPGLRREELASLCGISATWLTWIEQGRAVSLSSATLAALSDALMLTPAERAYLFDLAALRDREHPASASAAASREARSALAKSIAACRSAAYALDPAWNAVEWNRPAAALFQDWLGRGVIERNLLNYTFLDPRARRFIDDWPGRARRLVAEFRADRGTSLQAGATARAGGHVARRQPGIRPALAPAGCPGAGGWRAGVPPPGARQIDARPGDVASRARAGVEAGLAGVTGAGA